MAPALARRLVLSFLVLALSSLAQAAAADRPGPALTDLLAAEAARARTPEQLALLLETARRGVPDLQRVAVRALGRLERPHLVADLRPILSAANALVRSEAANALAQSAAGDGGASAAARAALLERLSIEKDPEVRGAICEALGRLPAGTKAEATEVEQLLLAETARVALKKGVSVSPASPLLGIRVGWGRSVRTATPAAVGALRGLESLIRLGRRTFSPSPATILQLRQLAVTAVMPARSLAFLALNDASGADAPTIARALRDEDVEVRRLAAASPTATIDDLRTALADPAAPVRYEALRAYGRRFQAQEGCAPVTAAVRDGSAHVALLALDLLGNSCRAADRAPEVLLDAAASLDPGGAAWHRAAHAIVSLAQVSPERAAGLLSRFLAAGPWPIRMYAARAAAVLGQRASLDALAADPNPNVREAAISGLSRVARHAADDAYLQALTGDDGQLVMSAAAALRGTDRKQEAAAGMIAALQRWTAGGSDTSRDPRLALLDGLREVASPAEAPSLAPLLRDFDARVAERVAQLLTSLTGRSVQAAPVARPPQAAPTARELSALSRSIVRVTMRSGGSFDVRLLTDLAPLSSAEFARHARAGYYNGLTFHRVVPNFLVQGGGPGANEYSGDSRFMVDEVGRMTQSRGTVGTSTRGRDTGDAQFYVNLVDNPRLDHDYTIFGQIVAGMEVVDGILEGDTIAQAEILPVGRRNR